MRRTLDASILPSAIAAMVITITLVLCLFGSLGYQAYARQQINNLDHQLQLTADKLSVEIAQPVWGFEFTQVHDIMHSALRDEQVYGLIVRHGKENFVIERGGQWQLQKTPVSDFDKPGLKSTSRDIVVNNRHTGTITVFVSGDITSSMLDDAALFFVASILIVDIVLILGLYFLFWRGVVRPLKWLEQYSKAVSEGHHEACTSPHPLKGEFVQLYSALQQNSASQQMVDAQTQQADTLREAGNQAEAANRTKSDFLAHMSHELRTPLNAILGYSRLMLEESGLSERQQRNLNIIQQSGTRLLNMISSILDVSKSETGQNEYPPGPIDSTALHHDENDGLLPAENTFSTRVNASPSPLLNAAPPQGPGLLIVDDTPEIRMLLRDLLEPLALDISEAGNAEEAMVYIESRHPQIVLLDWRLPGISGIELTRQVRERRDLPQPHIIMLTANAYPENRAAAHAAGVDMFMTKPINIEQLKHWLTQHFAPRPHDIPADNEPRDLDTQALNTAIAQLTETTRKQVTIALCELNPAKLKGAIDAVRTENAALARQLDADLQALRYRALWELFNISST